MTTKVRFRVGRAARMAAFGVVAGIVAFASGCRDSDDECGGCDQLDPFIVDYTNMALDEGSFRLLVDLDARYGLWVDGTLDDGTPISKVFCHAGQLSDDDVEWVRALFTANLVAIYELDMTEPDGRLRCEVRYGRSDDPNDVGGILIAMDEELEPPTATMLSALDDFANELFAREEYCDEYSESLAPQGTWVLPRSE